MASYLITGASRGVGLELCKQLLDLPTSQVSRIFLLSRGAPSESLQRLLDSSERATHIRGSVDDDRSITEAAAKVQRVLNGGGLDVLVNNAGMQNFQTGPTHQVLPAELAKHFDVNVLGCHRMIAAFVPLLMQGSHKTVINISSTMGSVALAAAYKEAPSTPYKVSKAALNMLNAQYALEYASQGFTFVCINPGWLKTDLGGQYADLDVETGVAALREVILKVDSSQNGKFLNIQAKGSENTPLPYDGGEVPW